MRHLLTLLCLLLALPVVGVLAAWLALDEAALAVLRHQWQTVLPDYALQSALLAAGVGLGVMALGAASAAAVTLFDFPGRRTLEWALLLPLAMPAYVLAYAWTDALQFSGPLQTVLRGTLGLRGALWPDVRSLPMAVMLFVLCLYPYVYLLTRAALGERAVRMMEAARLLGAPMRRRVLEVALPMARPAIAAGTALALMETLADYGVGSYFGLTTFSTGIYKAWLVMNDRVAAAQLAALLLVVVAALLMAERAAQRRLRFAGSQNAAVSAEARPFALHGAAAVAMLAACAMPVLLGFVLPVLWLMRLLWQETQTAELGLPWARFGTWAWVSFKLAALAALSATALVPGTLLGLLYAYLVRFSAVALQSVEAGYARVPLAIDETARMLGSGARRVFLQLHLPLLRRSAGAAALLVFVDVMKELPATLVLRPFGSDTLAVVAYNLARDERLAEAALPSLAIVAVGLIPVILLSRAMRAAPD